MDTAPPPFCQSIEEVCVCLRMRHNRIVQAGDDGREDRGEGKRVVESKIGFELKFTFLKQIHFLACSMHRMTRPVIHFTR